MKITREAFAITFTHKKAMGKGYVLPVRDCAQILGVTPDTLRARGYNPVERGKYDIAEIVAAEFRRVKGNDRRASIETEQALLLRARRQKLENTNAEHAATHVHIDDIISIMTDHINGAKKKLLTIGISVSQAVAAEDSPKRVAEIIGDEVKSALEELNIDLRKNFVATALRRLSLRMAAASETDAQSVDRKKPRSVSRVRNRTR